MIDTNYKYAQWSTNVNVSGMNWQTYHEGIWYDATIKTYDQAVEEIKETIRQKVLKDHPHLIAFKKEDEPYTTEDNTSITTHYPNGTYTSIQKESRLLGKIDKSFVSHAQTEFHDNTKKQTLEEQIQSSKDLDELDGWKYISKTNKKLQEIWNKRERELINQETA